VQKRERRGAEGGLYMYIYINAYIILTSSGGGREREPSKTCVVRGGAATPINCWWCLTTKGVKRFLRVRTSALATN